MIAHIAPPITTVFLVGLFWKNASAKGAQLTLWIGSFIGVVVFAINKLDAESVIGRVPFMMMAFYLFTACVVLQVVFSFVFPTVIEKESSDLYWKSPLDPLRGNAWKGVGNYKLLSGLLLATMALLYWIFR